MGRVPAALRLACAALALSCAARPAAAAPECIVPAKPGGGFDLTCKLAQRALQEAGMSAEPMRIAYLPGGIGAVAYNTVVAQRPAEADTLVAFSSGSLLALAEGKFGKYGAADVRWVGALAADYGVIAVRADSPWKTLKDLVAALAADPDQVLFGAGGTIGNQDWMKAALVARQARVGYKRMRFVGFEGGGEAFTALEAGHVQAVSGDASEAAMQLATGHVRILAVLGEQRLPGRLAAVPTAREQGYDITWPVVRGFYMGPKVAQADYRRWAARFERLQAGPDFARLRAAQGLYPAAMDAAALDAYVRQTVQRYAALAREFGLAR
ncbi:Bug family tripartite tricarboxylate transporter substrate binding protein [Cupriavidus sp. 30B13]|uniref:Bug family tripartite tricarboxylate transporter substrate binding protein n=1 Tax=Cupriavidus sp. 30B13 TaxID=3384241 RepID=UPI003B918D7A